MRVIKEKANAKINLYLDVSSVRDDGFHNIKSVMHSVTLCDDISIKYSPSKKTSIKVFVSGNRFLPTDEKNLAYRAAQIFLDRASLDADIEISITKRIPVAAGLAGGSADAAAVFRGMNKLFGRMFSDRALSDMSAVLGSDIPFCLFGKTALCEGRGEIMNRLSVSPSLKLVIAVANEHMSTPLAYKKLDEIYSSFDGSVPTGGAERFDALMFELAEGEIKSPLFNVFESAVLPMCKRAAEIKSRLLAEGASLALMSGSGPSVFGVFSNTEQAKSVAERLREEGINAHFAESVN